MKRRAILSIVISVLLVGCGREQHEVRTQLINGKVVFSTEGAVGLFPRKDTCLESFSVQDEAEQSVWTVEREKGLACQATGFPLVFGTVPPGFQTTTAAMQLKPSVIYVLSGDDARTSTAYSGGFRIKADGSLQSFALNDPEMQTVLSRWVAKDAARNGR
jgi:hypothetical protein